jgi:Cof subfamily protein (haloacid dehalogenase superfamily)
MIALVISDVDGTLVTPDKQLTEASVRAVQRLHDCGICFSVTSSRPPFGLQMLVQPLSLTLPLGAFNGAAIVGPDMQILEHHLLPEVAARRSVGLISRCGADVWVYTADQWLVADAMGAYVEREARTIQAQPTVVEDLVPYLHRAAKIVGVSEDFAALAKCEADIRRELAGTVSVARSQAYYVDVTPAGLDKGTFVDTVGARLAVPPEQIAVLGDMENDLPMFRRAGTSIAMGNADDALKSHASFVTRSNASEGFAYAVEKFVLQGV